MQTWPGNSEGCWKRIMLHRSFLVPQTSYPSARLHNCIYIHVEHVYLFNPNNIFIFCYIPKYIDTFDTDRWKPINEYMDGCKTRRKALTPYKDSEGPPLFSGSDPWLHSPGKCWALWKETTILFLTLSFRALSLTGWAVPVQQMGYCEVSGRADSLSLWPGSLGSRGALALTEIPVRLLVNARLAHSLPTCPPNHAELKASQQNVTFSIYWA